MELLHICTGVRYCKKDCSIFLAAGLDFLFIYLVVDVNMTVTCGRLINVWYGRMDLAIG